MSYASVPSCESCSRNNASGGAGDSTLCPPRMSDARAFTDYRPRLDANVLAFAGVPGKNTSLAYRQHMIAAAETIMTQQRAAARAAVACAADIGYDLDGTMLPEAAVSVCDAHGCATTPGAATGLGLGRAATPGAVPRGPTEEGSPAAVPSPTNGGVDQYGLVP